MQKAVEIIRNSGKTVGTFTNNPETAKKWIDCGVQYIGLGIDVSIFLQGCQALVRGVRG